MFRFILISETINKVPCPFVLGIQRSVDVPKSGMCYLIHGLEMASRFEEFNFTTNRIRDDVYWFSDEKELDSLIPKLMSYSDLEPKPIYDIRQLDFKGKVFYYVHDDNMFMLADQFYVADLSILSRINQMRIDVDYVLEDNFVDEREMMVAFKEIGLLDEAYSMDNFILYMKRFGFSVHLLYLERYVDSIRDASEVDYRIGGKYPNPFMNLLLVEEYLNNQVYHNIDVDKCNDYDLKFDKLPARYSFNGFYSTTGRIFCSSDNWTPIQNVAKNKRDILFAEDGCYLIEFDYKSFEFDILCQILGIKVEEDPHAATYAALVGSPHPDSRKIGKMINYAFLYGMNETRLAERVASDLGDTVRLDVNDFLNRLSVLEITSRVKEFDSVLKRSASNNVVKNYFGRSIHFKKDYAYLNNYIQSTAADFVNNKFLRLIDVLKGKNRVLLQNFDSILIQMTEHEIERTDTFEKVLNILREPINDIYGRIEYKYGRDWGNME